MSSRSDLELVLDMLEAIRRAALYINDLSYAEFMTDVKTQDAVIRALEVLGEACKGVSPVSKSRFSDIPWKKIAGLRDKLIHDYFGVNLDIVWEVVTVEISHLEPQLRQILDNQETL